MGLFDVFIRRPVLAAVLNLLIVVVGLVAAGRLPVRELPDVDAAAVTIQTLYTGAAPEVIDSQITELLESAVAGVAGIDSIASTSEQGRSTIRITFTTGRDLDEAANDVRNAVGRVVDRLPDETGEPRIFKNDSDADPVLRVAIVSDRMDAAALTDFAQRFVIDRLSTLEGVASVNVFGERAYAMRVALDPAKLAARRLTVTDVADALRSNNLELPAGEVISVNRQFRIRASTRIDTPEGFAAIVLRVVDGAPIRLGDVADVFVGVEDDQSLVRSDGQASIGLGVSRQSQANTIAISDAVRAEIAAMTPTLPDGLRMFVTSDDALFIRSAIEEVGKTLIESALLVVAVIFVFLGSPRATLVPAVTIPVALIGSFAAMLALGYSINILTLFAMILAIGIVVDDAIVVLENIQRRVAAGEHPVAAAARGTREVGFAVIATSVTLMAVFIPISFLEGQVGKLFVEFGMVMAVAVALSTVTALTLCPVMCWLLLRRGSGGLLERGVNAGFDRIERAYGWLLRVCLGAPIVVLGIAAACVAAAVWLAGALPRELTPREDRGVFFVAVTAPQGSTVAYTDREAREVEAALAPLRETGEIASVFTFIGRNNQPHSAFVVARLAPWDSGRRPSHAIVGELIPKIASIPGARAFPIQPAGLGLRGSSNPVRVRVLGPDFESVKEWAAALRGRMAEMPTLQNVEIGYEETQPELRVDIDRALADDLGVSIEDVAATLQTFFASREVTRYLDRGREYPVILQAREDARRTREDAAQVFVRSQTTGALIPLSALVRVAETTASPELARWNRLPAITLSAALAPGADIGAAIDAVTEAAADALPPEGRIAWEGQAKEYLDGSAGVATTLIFALVIVYLVLAAQFESFVDPVTILLGAPLAVTGALGAIWLTGQTLNVYTQVGMLLLLGLMAKNGILIVEFANQLRDRGAAVRAAALEASVRRLRPILMTTVGTLIGTVPLVWSSGAGAEARSAIGLVILGGFGFAALLTLFVTPVLYDLLARLTKPRAHVERTLEAALGGPGPAE